MVGTILEFGGLRVRRMVAGAAAALVAVVAATALLALGLIGAVSGGLAGTGSVVDDD